MVAAVTPRSVLLVPALLGSLLLGPLVLSTSAVAQQPSGIAVKTEVFGLTFSVQGGVPVAWTVADPTGGEGARESLIDTDLVASTVFRVFAVAPTPTGDGVPEADLRTYAVERSSEAGRHSLKFTSPVADGLQVVKTYEFSRASHLFSLRVDMINSGTAARDLAPVITLGPGLGFSPERNSVPFDEGRTPSVLPFFKTAEGLFGVDVPREEPFLESYPPEGEGHPEGEGLQWGGVHSQYFTVVLLPPVESADTPPLVRAKIGLASSDAEREYYPVVGFFHPSTSLAPGATWSTTYSVYAGPKDRALLEATGLGLEAVPFHHLWDWLASICIALQNVIGLLESVLGSWGLAIVVFAVLFRLVTLPLSFYGGKHQMLMKAKMTMLKPLVAELKAKHKNADKRNDAILKLYKEHGVNPFAQFKGCLPLLIQLPVLIALFQLLLNSYDLRGVSSFWIDDLTLSDRLFPLGFSLPWLGSYFNLLPILMFAAQIVSARAMSKGSEKTSGAIYLMPVAMTLLFYPFPAGCMLFWTTGNIIQLFEQKYIVARFGDATS